MTQCDWCWRDILLSLRWNFNESIISIFMKTTYSFYDTNQILKEKNKVFKPYEIFRYLTQ